MAEIQSPEDWAAAKGRYRSELEEMLGLNPMPERTPLNAVITGTSEIGDVTVDRLHFQSRPGLYVTANFYRPKESSPAPLPAILYLCGHGASKKGNVSFGNKASYHHHGLWFARNGYVCLVIDSLQLGEIEGIHHGTYKMNRWWWQSRGYSPAGVEAWNCVRALDYLETRPEVDRERIGVTGRSGGGAYSWWITALDERVKVSVPVAGITNMRNHVVDGVIEGHCDCMFQVNTYQWDFPMLAALAAPRPLLIVNTDKDEIFPLDGVVDVYNKTRRIYRLLGQEGKIGLSLYEGPHKDTQPLRTVAFHWFERFLKGRTIDDEISDLTAPKLMEPESLRVFEKLPDDEINTRIDETFVGRPQIEIKIAPDEIPSWSEFSEQSMKALAEKSFRAWPTEADPLNVREVESAEHEGMRMVRLDFLSQEPYHLSIFVACERRLEWKDLDLMVLEACGDDEWAAFLKNRGAAFPELFEGLGVQIPELDTAKFEEERKLMASQKWGFAIIAPRGIGPTAWTQNPTERIHILRRFALLGQTLDGMQVWDIRRATQALRKVDGLAETQLWMQGRGVMAGNVLYASLFEPNIYRLELHRPSATHEKGPTYLNVMKVLEMPETVALAAGRSRVRIYTDMPDDWAFVTEMGVALGWEKSQFSIFEEAR